jgi:hypothetical protein
MVATELKELVELKPRKLKPDQVFLDPHNPRLEAVQAGESP